MSTRWYESFSIPLLSVFLLGSPGFASAKTSTPKAVSVATVPDPSPTGAPATPNSEVTPENSIGLQSVTFPGGQDTSGRESLSLIGFEGKIAGEKKAVRPGDLHLKGSAEGLIGTGNSRYRFAEVPEAFIGYRAGDATKIAIGRKKNIYSQLDENWSLGLTQPQFQWDYLHPESVGLLGLHGETKLGAVTIRGFYSPLFVPNRGSPVEFQNGRVKSVLPWSANPPETVTLQGKPVDLRYRAEIPKLTKLLQQTTVGGQVAIDVANDTNFSASAFSKPMNTLLFSYEPNYNLTTQTADVVLYPRVARHFIASGDVAQKIRFGSVTGAASFSAVYEAPDDVLPSESVSGVSLGSFGAVKSTRTTQRVGKSTLLSPTIGADFYANRPEEGGVSLSYLRRFGENPPDIGDQSNGRTSFFPPVIRFDEAGQLRLRFPTFREFTLENRVIYDIRNPATIFSTQLSFAATKNLKLFAVADILSSYVSETETNAKISANEYRGFIQSNEQNDRFQFGAAYVF